jgi:hypothetical protein
MKMISSSDDDICCSDDDDDDDRCGAMNQDCTNVPKISIPPQKF